MTARVFAIESILSPFSDSIGTMARAYPHAFQAEVRFDVCDDIIAMERVEFQTPSFASVNILRQAGYFLLIAEVMHMINREKNKPRVNWDMVEDAACLLEGVVERWAPYLERYEDDEDPLLENYFHCIAEGEVHSDDEEEGRHPDM